jgi:hypothetical protein
MFWFGKKSSRPETSPGGSVIHRYQESTWSGSRVAYADESAAEFAEARKEVYQRFFGKVHNVFDEAPPLIPRVDVHAYYRRDKDGRRVCTLVTSGMSDLEMDVRGVKAPRRAELIFYCLEHKQEYIDTMRWLAHFPHDQKTWIGSAHTIPNGNPPAPFWGSSVLDTILLLPTIVNRDASLPSELILGGAPVHFLWVVPLTTPECDLKLAGGVDAILDLFERNRHPHVFDPNRTSYV